MENEIDEEKDMTENAEYRNEGRDGFRHHRHKHKNHAPQTDAGAGNANDGESGDARHFIEEIARLSDEIKSLKEQVKTLEDEKAKLNNDMLLVRADAENYRKRADKDRMESVSFANKKIVEDMLPSLDSIDIAVSTIQDENVRKGVELISTTMMTALGKWGLESIAPLDVEFDPSCCEACLFEEREGIEVDTVIRVLQKGYKLNGKVIRPAKVKIAKPAAE